jgi:hypothetical protein
LAALHVFENTDKYATWLTTVLLPFCISEWFSNFQKIFASAANEIP